MFDLQTRPLITEAGFRYYPDLITEELEDELLQFINTLDFQPYVMRGQASRRGIVRFGHDYGPVGGTHHVVQPLAQELIRLRAVSAEKAGLNAEDFVASVVTSYPPGATIGWHSDTTRFGPVVLGVSLVSSCTFRFRPKSNRRKNYKINLEPRSLYVMEGEIRSDWEHSIPPVKTLRYSITFRTLLDE
ncbi:MAG TPA: alpha-ketoglutarate-dependent dioxygenase AlkB [Acidobacteriota bacterium]|nr:alpha-ketoglutarate-dependent dioxygenase AlkB [Acidobacteriota bacterium]